MLVPALAFSQDFAFEFADPGAPEPDRLEGSVESIAIDADGNPWVAELHGDASRVVKYTYNGEFVAAFNSFGEGEVPVITPWGIAADDFGFIYVAQGSAEPRIAKLDTGGRLIRTFRLELPDGTLVDPYKLDGDDEGRLYGSDSLRDVDVFSPEGAYIDRIRLPAGQTVLDVTISGDEVFVSFATGAVDNAGFRIYDAGLSLQEVHSYPDVGFRELAVDLDGTVLITDYKNSVVRRYDRAGTQTGSLGTRGIGTGEMNGPAAIDIDCRGNVYAVDSAARYDGPGGPRAGSKVQKFAQSGAAPPPCAPRPLPEGSIDTQINDVEVTQGVQPAFSYTAGPVLPPGQFAFDVPETEPRTRAYGFDQNGAATGEVPLKAHLKTVVRVYANLDNGPAGGIANVPATLEAVLPGGRRVGPIQALSKPALLRSGDRTVDGEDQTSPTAPYTFDLPESWMDEGGPIELVARVNPAGIGCDTECVNRSTFRLTGVPRDTVRLVPIKPVALTYHGALPIKDPARAFVLAQRTTPLLLEVDSYRAQAEVGDLLDATSVTVESCFIGIFPCDEDTYDAGSAEFREYVQGELVDRLDDAADDADLESCDRVPFGLVKENANLPGSTTGEFLAAGFFPCALAYATVYRPLTAVAHELQHAFGRPHAGQNCPGTAEGDDQEGEPWPPDDRGLLGGIGLNTGTRSSSGRGPHDIIAPGVGGHPAELFDLMSYCSPNTPSLDGVEPAAWISPRGWRNLANWRSSPRPASARSATAARGPATSLLSVTAIELANGDLGITGVSPSRAQAPAADPASPYVLESMDAAGNVLASAAVDADPLDESGSKVIRGTVPAPPGTAQVFLRRGDEIGTRRVGSANPPSVKLRSPRGGTRVAGGRVVVTWKSADPDGGQLAATVEYSADGGKSWQGVHVGPDEGRVAIPRGMLRGSRHARVRVRIDDGFHEAIATSKPFVVVPPPPLVRIVDPAGKVTIPADAPLELRGEAVGPRGPLPAKRLRWLDGRRKLGTGDARTVAGLSPGRHRLVLEASQGGAVGRAELAVRVTAVEPAFLRLDAPPTVGGKAKQVSLRVASTVRAKLRAAGRSYAVSPRARKVKLPARGKQAVVLNLTLKAGKLATHQKLTIPRA
jgi:hypothetical protein